MTKTKIATTTGKRKKSTTGRNGSTRKSGSSKRASSRASSTADGTRRAGLGDASYRVAEMTDQARKVQKAVSGD